MGHGREREVGGGRKGIRGKKGKVSMYLDGRVSY